MEREIIARMQEGNQRGYGDSMLVSPQVPISTENRHPELSASQRQAVYGILISREKIVGLDGVAGAGKITTLSVIREAAVAEGYHVEGFVPTSRAAQSTTFAHWCRDRISPAQIVPGRSDTRLAMCCATRVHRRKPASERASTCE
jgi:hypothetical protein